MPPPAGQPPIPTELAPLNERQQKLLTHLRVHGRITRHEYVQWVGTSVPTAARDLKELVDRGLIRGIGPLAKGRYYALA
jgi:ATP-dependent DNA helicase RecG